MGRSIRPTDGGVEDCNNPAATVKTAGRWKGRFMRAAMLRAMACVAAGLAMAGAVGCDKVKVSDQQIQIIKESEMEAAIGDPETVIVDVRKPAAFAAGHLPNAINIFLPDIREADPRLGIAKRIIVYSGGWTDPLSTAAAKRLMAMGYTGVAEFKGGLELWKDSGRQIVGSVAPANARPETGR
jgi:rhodanese-related sulfurtransferase